MFRTKKEFKVETWSGRYFLVYAFTYTEACNKLDEVLRKEGLYENRNIEVINYNWDALQREGRNVYETI